MALYKNNEHLQLSDKEAFDQIFDPRVQAVYSGIYQCTECGKNATAVAGGPLPPENHHQHTREQGPIRWRLAVAQDE
jgi:hypothetical protein